jgi:hypothetical protein
MQTEKRHLLDLSHSSIKNVFKFDSICLTDHLDMINSTIICNVSLQLLVMPYFYPTPARFPENPGSSQLVPHALRHLPTEDNILEACCFNIGQ